MATNLASVQATLRKTLLYLPTDDPLREEVRALIDRVREYTLTSSADAHFLSGDVPMRAHVVEDVKARVGMEAGMVCAHVSERQPEPRVVVFTATMLVIVP